MYNPFNPAKDFILYVRVKCYGKKSFSLIIPIDSSLSRYFIHSPSCSFFHIGLFVLRLNCSFTPSFVSLISSFIPFSFSLCFFSSFFFLHHNTSLTSLLIQLFRQRLSYNWRKERSRRCWLVLWIGSIVWRCLIEVHNASQRLYHAETLNFNRGAVKTSITHNTSCFCRQCFSKQLHPSFISSSQIIFCSWQQY